MSNNNRAKKIMSGLGWSFGERILAQLVTFIVSIILARLLLPEEYGVISLVMVFINLANVFVTNGFGESLVQKKDASFEDFSTVFWCTFVFSGLLYLLLFTIAPYVGEFYGNTEIILVLRVLSLKIPLSSINTIQHAYVAKRLEFKKFFFSTLGGTILSGIIGIIMAYLGYGVWALIAQYLINSFTDTIVLLITVRWYPRFVFNFDHAKLLIGYAWKSTGAAFIDELYTQIRSLIIGKVYSPADLAYYNRGNQIPNLFITNVNSSINKVFFPVMSTAQDKKNDLKQLASKTLRISSFIIFPLMVGLIAVAEPLVKVLLTDKWLPSVPYLRILCIFWMTLPLQSINWQLMKAIGRSDLCLKLEVIKKIIGFALILLTMYISVEALAWSTTLFAIISTIINMMPIRKLIGYELNEQVRDIIPNLFLAIIMGGIVFILSYILNIPNILLLIVQVFTGIVVYVLEAMISKNASFNLLKIYAKRYVFKYK